MEKTRCHILILYGTYSRNVEVFQLSTFEHDLQSDSLSNIYVPLTTKAMTNLCMV